MSDPKHREKPNVAVIGAAGGIGGALARHYANLQETRNLFTLARRDPAIGANAKFIPVDVTDEESIKDAAEKCRVESGLDIIILATGMLHDGDQIMPEKSLRDISARNMHRIIDVNTIGPALMMKHFLPLLPRERPAVFAALSARVGSISDNHLGGWYAYRASKAALNMLIRTASIEFKRRHPMAAVIGLHPGTVDTALSMPFKGNVAPDKLFSPAYAAARLIEVIGKTTPEDSGKIFAWDGSIVPY